jgi:hypothetical protein
VERTSERNVKKILKNTPEGKSLLKNQERDGQMLDESDLKRLGVRGWRKIAEDRDFWKLILKGPGS